MEVLLPSNYARPVETFARSGPKTPPPERSNRDLGVWVGVACSLSIAIADSPRREADGAEQHGWPLPISSTTPPFSPRPLEKPAARVQRLGMHRVQIHLSA